MKTETTTQQFEVTQTRYLCEEEGCGFTTTDEREAEEHPWRSHKDFNKVRIDLWPYDELRESSTLVFFSSEEDYKVYQQQRLGETVDRNLAERWKGPGWYETWVESVPCGRRCCTDEALFMRPASVMLRKLKQMRETIDETLTMLERRGVTHDVG